MNITISKEGSNPVTIDTSDGKIVRSTEGIKDAGGISKGQVAQGALTGATAASLAYLQTHPDKAIAGAQKIAKFIVKNTTGKIDYARAYITALKSLGQKPGLIDLGGNIVQGAGNALQGIAKLASNIKIPGKGQALNNALSTASSWLGKQGQMIVGKGANVLGQNATSTILANGGSVSDAVEAGRKFVNRKIAQNTAQNVVNTNASTAATSTGKVLGGITKAGDKIKGAFGGGTLGNVAAAGASILAQITLKALAGTVFNSATSIGKFNSGAEMLSSKPLINAVNEKIIDKYRPMGFTFPTAEEVKQDPKAKNKSGFLGWILGGGQTAGSKVSSMAGSSASIVKDVDGVAVSVTKLTPAGGSLDLKQLGGLRIMIATAFVRNPKGKIKSIPLCRGYLTKGNIVNASREAADIFFSEESETPITKKDIINYISMSRESSNPKLNDEMMFFLREATI
jgi:hypothetical protein